MNNDSEWSYLIRSLRVWAVILLRLWSVRVSCVNRELAFENGTESLIKTVLVAVVFVLFSLFWMSV